MDRAPVKQVLKALKVETASWAFGNSGTRFKVFPQPGVPRTPFEKLQDAAQVHRYTGIAPTVALHIPWDKVDDYRALARAARDLGISIGAINPNLFQDERYKLGSICHHDPAVRQAAVDHMLECIEVARHTGSKVLKLWFADGTNYPGQASIPRRKAWMEECLAKAYAALPQDMIMLLEYKFYEPAFYHTDLADWGMAFVVASKLGPRAQVLVDLGHHAQGTNIEHIVAFLLSERKLGGFDLNSRKYGDDDLMVGALNPYELFLIFDKLVEAKANLGGPRVDYMLDQCHNIEPKIPAVITSVMNVQASYTKALLVDRDALTRAQEAGDVLCANRILRDAFETDVRPLLAEVRQEMGLDPDPLRAYLASGYGEKIIKERQGGKAMGWS